MATKTIIQRIEKYEKLVFRLVLARAIGSTQEEREWAEIKLEAAKESLFFWERKLRVQYSLN